ncbi:hypothetical protein H2203_003840 [Taxawa tesnikishii (nom. ined.)]|nr:hypothetical protein H2203_003840 [Dothideales sp. JES 119]
MPAGALALLDELEAPARSKAAPRPTATGRANTTHAPVRKANGRPAPAPRHETSLAPSSLPTSSVSANETSSTSSSVTLVSESDVKDFASSAPQKIPGTSSSPQATNGTTDESGPRGREFIPTPPKKSQTWNDAGLQAVGYRARRGSKSHEDISRFAQQFQQKAATHDEDEEPDLLYSFSARKAVAGVGTKSRRLSTVLPEGFLVQTSRLEDDYVSTSRRLLVRRLKRKIIGWGGFAEVELMKPIHGPEGVLVAVKQFRPPDRDDDPRDYESKIKSEYTIASSCHHPNIIHCERLCCDKKQEHWSSVMEYCDYGDVYTLIRNGVLNKPDARCIFKQLLRGVAYLHSHGIAHRDLKPENMMVTRQGCLKIIDFGLSEVFSGIHPGLRAGGGECGRGMREVRLSSPAELGSQPYRSPEVEAANVDFDPRGLDVWSCAIVFMTMMSGKHPWLRAAKQDRMYAQFQESWRRWCEKHPERATLGPDEQDIPSGGPIFRALNHLPTQRLVLSMLHPDPRYRFSARDALDSDVVRSMECCQLDPEEVGEEGGRDVHANHRHQPPPKEKEDKEKEHSNGHSGAGGGEKEKLTDKIRKRLSHRATYVAGESPV